MVSEVRVELWLIDKLVFYARNPQKRRRCGSLVPIDTRVCFKIPVPARSDGQVVDGHLLLKTARKLES
jgi:hypothetical protein